MSATAVYTVTAVATWHGAVRFCTMDMCQGNRHYMFNVPEIEVKKHYPRAYAAYTKAEARKNEVGTILTELSDSDSDNATKPQLSLVVRTLLSTLLYTPSPHVLFLISIPPPPSLSLDINESQQRAESRRERYAKEAISAGMSIRLTFTYTTAAVCFVC